MALPSGTLSYRFRNVVLDCGRQEIRVDGRLLEAQPKVLDLLRYLIEQRDRVVDKAELMDALWPDVVVTEASLTQALKKARRLVGDDGDQQHTIKTVQRRGFRFVAELHDTHDEPVTAQAARVEEPSVAVLTFTDMSAEKNQQHLCDGMAEEIINALTRIDGLRVAARSSAFSLRNDAADARQIGARLQVKSIVEGSVQRAGERLRVTARLIDATTGYQQWSERWDRDVADVFAIQDEIAVRVAEALKMHLSNAERDAIHSVRPREVGVYELYLRALTFRNAFGSRSQRFAIEMLERALAIDSAYAPAWAALATCHVLLYLYAEASEEHRIKASDASARAIALDPLSAEAHTSSGCAATLRGEFGAAEQAFRRAQALNPRLFEAWYYHARCCASLGAHERAVQLYERAAQTRPEDYEAWNMAVQSWRSLGQPVQAERAARRCVAAAERALTLDPGDVRGLCLGAGALALLGQAELARSWTEQALALDPNEAHVLYNAACVYVAIDEHEMAIDCFERMNVAAMANRSWMENDSWLDPLRAHPRFQALLSQAR